MILNMDVDKILDEKYKQNIYLTILNWIFFFFFALSQKLQVFNIYFRIYPLDIVSIDIYVYKRSFGGVAIKWRQM